MKATCKYQEDFRCLKLVKEVVDLKNHLLMATLDAAIYPILI